MFSYIDIFLGIQIQRVAHTTVNEQNSEANLWNGEHLTLRGKEYPQLNY